MLVPVAWLIHHGREEARARAALERLGFEVRTARSRGSPALREVRAARPDAVVIDLDRLPSHGREMGLSIRRSAATRELPLVFLGGDAEKVGGVRARLPDATYASWRGAKGAIQKAIARPPSDPVVPAPVLDAYAGRPLAAKLGLRDGLRVALLAAPSGFADRLDGHGAAMTARLTAKTDLVVCFVRSRADLARRLAVLARRTELGGVWFAWPKKASGVETDLGGAVVREMGLAAGLVDFKIASVDATWSALRFARRRRGPGR